MIGLYILIALPILFFGLGLFFIRKFHEDLGSILCIFGVISIMLLFVLVMGRDNRSKNERHILEEYESMKAKVEVINTFPPDIRIALDTCWPDLKKSVSEINWHIEKNKTYISNPFNSWLMSEKIATLEPLKYE